MILEKELYRLARLHQKAGLKPLKESIIIQKAYDEYISSVIEEQPKEQRRTLYDLYERIKLETL